MTTATKKTPKAKMTPDARAALARAGFSRRDFFKTSGVLIVGFNMAGPASERASAQGMFEGGAPGTLARPLRRGGQETGNHEAVERLSSRATSRSWSSTSAAP